MAVALIKDLHRHAKKKKKKHMKITQVIIRPKTTSIFSALIATEPLICLYLKGSAVNHGEYHKHDVMQS